MQIGGIHDIAIVADGVAAWGRNTSNWRWRSTTRARWRTPGKMTALKLAVRNLLDDDGRRFEGDPSMVKISIVPFNTQVQADRDDLKPGSSACSA